MFKKTLILSNSLLTPTLPILEKDLEESYKKQIALFNKLIKAKTEDKDFFAAPVLYLTKNGALPFDKIELPDGTTVPVVDDNTLAATIRKARELYQKGSISGSEIKSNICYKNSGTAWYVKRNESTDELRSVIVEKATSTDEGYFTNTSESALCYKHGKNELRVDNILIGPLVNPTVLSKARLNAKMK